MRSSPSSIARRCASSPCAWHEPDLGAALLSELAGVAPGHIDVARFFADELLVPESSSYLGTGDSCRADAAIGLLLVLVLDEHRRKTTPTVKSGKSGKTNVTYTDVDDAVPCGGSGDSSTARRR